MATYAGGDAAATRLVTVAHDPGHYIAGRIGNVITFYWLKSGTPQGVEALNQLCEQVSRGCALPFSAIHIVRADVGLPEAPVRQALVASMKKFADVTCCLAIVTLGAGFWVSALQSVVTGIRMLAPVGASMLRFVPKAEDLRGWFVDEHVARTGVSVDDACLVEAVREMLALGEADASGMSRQRATQP
jgi:hypothetical protein